jgi:hypothetical protein
MKYMMMFKSDEPPPPGQSACKQHVPEMARLHDELRRAGVMLVSEGLLPSTTGARVTHDRGRISVMDGPFAEAKELIAGFCVVRVDSKAEAVDLAGRFLTIAGGGRCELLEVFEPNPETER